MELVRIDIDGNYNETITIKKSELKSLLRKARKTVKTADPADPLILRHTVKKTGVYFLKKVLDQSKLEVRPRASSVVVATCPQARVSPTGDHRCRNDLSNVALEVEGVPPLYVKYHLTVDDKPRGGSELQNLQADDFISPLSRHTPQALIKSGPQDVSWARPQTVTVPLNEILAAGSKWEYSIDEVRDGLGNFVSFVAQDEEDRPRTKHVGIQQSFQVHERPKISLEKCNPQHPLQAAKGDVVRLPVHYFSSGKGAINGPHAIEYLFTPEADIVVDGHHSPNAELKKQTMKSAREVPLISAAGLYTIKSVSTDFCEGEVLEPTSCLLQNPPEPELSLTSEDIVDKCAGNPIGLRVGLDLIGTPPFFITYTEQRRGDVARPRHQQLGSLRGTIDLTPTEKAGHYTYTFDTISDAVYKERPLHNLQLQQDVKPPATAHFIKSNRPKQACIDDTVEFDVALDGEGPYKLEYEVVHNGKRTKHAIDIEDKHYTIKTQKLKSGGEYTVALTSITDGMGCKDILRDEDRVVVRHERPKAYFGHIEGKQSVMALEGRTVELPIRLTGAGPWRVEYQNVDTNQAQKLNIPAANSYLPVKEQGTYQLLSVRDSVCPGFIDEKAAHFNVDWIARPQISIPASSSMAVENGKYIKDAVCEGDEDAFDVTLIGMFRDFIVHCLLTILKVTLLTTSPIDRNTKTNGVKPRRSAKRIFVPLAVRHQFARILPERVCMNTLS